MTQTRRNRGAQRGNQNARKHGFYSSALSPTQASEFWAITRLEGVAPPIALLRIKLQSSLQRDPGNHRVITDASRLLAKWYSAQYGLDGADRNYLRAVIEQILETAFTHHSATPTSPPT